MHPSKIFSAARPKALQGLSVWPDVVAGIPIDKKEHTFRKGMKI